MLLFDSVSVGELAVDRQAAFAIAADTGASIAVATPLALIFRGLLCFLVIVRTLSILVYALVESLLVVLQGPSHFGKIGRTRRGGGVAAANTPFVVVQVVVRRGCVGQRWWWCLLICGAMTAR